MSFAGLKKTMNKTQQFLNEKIGKAEGTKIDEEYMEMDRQSEAVALTMGRMNDKILEYLQPNPMTRAKLTGMAQYARARGTAAEQHYPQTERGLAEVLVKSAEEIGPSSSYAGAVNSFGESFFQLAEIKDSLDCDIKQNFIDPLNQVLQTDVKENIQIPKKKMNSRRLDYDYKISQNDKGKVTAEELQSAEDKFNESLEQTEMGIRSFLQSEEDHISQMMSLVSYMEEYHHNSLSVMANLKKELAKAKDQAASKPKQAASTVSRVSSVHNPGPRQSFDISTPVDARPVQSSFRSYNETAPPPPPAKKPSCRVLFDFEAENASELDLKENEIVTLLKQVDENWFEGEVNGKSGFFPTNYVEVITPL